MKIIKLGIILWLGIILVGCTPTKVAELTKATIQEDAKTRTTFIDKIESIQEFKISSDTTQDKTRVIMGKLSAVTDQVTITGYFKLTYEVIKNQWSLKYGSFEPFAYADIDPALTPDDAKIRNDLEHLSTMPKDLISVDSITYSLESPTAIDLIAKVQVTMTTAKGKINATVLMTYYFEDFQWNLGNNIVTLDSITDITLLPNEQDMIALAAEVFKEPESVISGEVYHVVSTKLDLVKGIVITKIHADSGSDRPVWIKGDFTVTGTMDIEQGWVYEITAGELDKRFTVTGNYHMVWDSVSANENQVSKGDTVDLELSGWFASVVLYSAHEEETVSTISGSVTLNGIKHQITSVENGMDPVYKNFRVALRNGTQDNEVLYFCYGPLETNGAATYYVLTDKLSYAFIPK